MTISSTAATVCCLVAGTLLGSSARVLFPVAGVAVVTAATFHGADGSVVPCAVWKEKQS